MSESSRELLQIAGFTSGLARMRALLEAGADVNVTGLTGETPLIQAAKRGSVPAVAMLITAGAPLDATDHDGYQALYWACRYRQSLAVVHQLITAGAQPNGQMSAWLAGWTDVDFTRAFSVQGVSYLYPGALVALTLRGNVDSVRGFISAGFGVNDHDDRGVTALMVAAARPWLGLLDDLLSASADVNAVDHSGLSVLGHAVMHHTTKPVDVIITQLRTLFAAGAQYPVPSTSADPLRLLASANCLGVVQYLAPVCPLAVIRDCLLYAVGDCYSWLFRELIWREHRGVLTHLVARPALARRDVYSWLAHRAPYSIRRAAMAFLPLPIRRWYVPNGGPYKSDYR